MRDVSEHRPDVVRGFRLRGQRNVSRIESFSDAVFGFSVTLLVVSLQVPKTFDELLRMLAGLPAFALSFALLALIWYSQNRFFRRFGLQDAMTVFLNIALLFVIVFFTYPLKFLFSFAVTDSRDVIRDDQIALMYAVYALGYAAIFGIFLLLHAHALQKRFELELTLLEINVTHCTMALAAFQIAVAATSAATALLLSWREEYLAASRYSGLAYLSVPIGVRVISVFYDRKLRVKQRALVPTNVDERGI